MTDNDNKDSILLGGEFISLMRPPKKKRWWILSPLAITITIAIVLALGALGAAAFALFGYQLPLLSEADSTATQTALKSTEDALVGLKSTVDALSTQQGTSVAFIESQFQTATAIQWTPTPSATPTATATFTPSATFTPLPTVETQTDSSDAAAAAGTENTVTVPEQTEEAAAGTTVTTDPAQPQEANTTGFRPATIVDGGANVRSSTTETSPKLYDLLGGSTVELVLNDNSNPIREWESAKTRYWYRVKCDEAQTKETTCWIADFLLDVPQDKATATPAPPANSNTDTSGQSAPTAMLPGGQD